jgi:protein TonB
VRSSVLGSTAVHVAALAGLLAVRQNAPIVVPGPEVVQVALLDAASLAPHPQPVAPPEKPAFKEPEVKPTDDTGIKLEKPKPKPGKKEPAKEEEAPPLPAPSLPYAAVGPAGLRGQVSVDARDFEFTYYLVLVRNKIAQNWTPPGGLAGGSGARAIVFFRIGRDGSVRGAQLESGSRFEYFDRSALRAVVLSDPLPPLPLGFNGGDLGVHFGFEYAGP